ncbi:hypothetical protein KA107_00415 [Candidatus Pacearchaeota archaeon]|nr:hypothetical protein [Candidatus Pacearchaeota archaeon]
MKKDKSALLSRPFYVAGVCSIVSILFALIGNVLLSLFPYTVTNYFYSFGAFLLSLPIYYAFFVLGQRYNNKLLRVLSILAMVFGFVLLLTLIGFTIHTPSYFNEINQTVIGYNATLASLNATGNFTESQANILMQEAGEKIVELLLPILAIGLVLVIVFIIYIILWGVALTKLDKKVKYAKIAGILTIVGAATLIIFVGLFVLLAAAIFEIMILFDQAKKFKEY